MKTIAIIVAGGKGRRMGRPKQFLKISGKPIIEWTLAAFQKCQAIDGIILVVGHDCFNLARKFKFSKLSKIVPAGRERPDSVRHGLKALPADAEIVAIHDGARPLISAAIIERAVEEAKRSGAAVVGVPVKDTIKEMCNDQWLDKLATSTPSEVEGFPINTNEEFIIKRTVDRKILWQAQTPQVFRKDLILKAYKKGYNSKTTDDSMLVERLGVPVRLVMGSFKNIKVTTPEDLAIMAVLLKRREK